MSNTYRGKSAFTPIILSQRPSSVINNMKNNSILQRLEQNSFKVNKNIKEFPKQNIMPNKTFYKEKSYSHMHPLDFYSLGKIPPNTMYSNLIWNKAVKSTSNDIIKRNALSINTKEFNQMNVHKKLSDISEQNIAENNYMNPLKTFQTYEKCNLKRCATNREQYNILKEKYFSRDINSTIAQGKCLSKKDFLKEKEDLLSARLSSNKENKCKRKDKTESSKSFSCGFEYKSPFDNSKQILESNKFYFDKNLNQMLKNKIWAVESKE